MSKDKSRYEARYDTRYDTGYKVRTRTKESRSIDRAETENLTELNAKESRQSRAENVENEESKPVPKSLTEDGSVRGRSLQSSSSTGSTRNQDQLSFVNDPDFSVNVSCQRTGNEVLILF